MKSGLVKILISDTNPNVLRALKHVLDKHRYGVCTASNASKLQYLLKNNRFDLVLLDLTIPTLKGLDIIDLIHQSSTSTAIVSVCDTSHYDMAIESVRRGAYDLLIKPYDTLFILPILRRAMYDSAQNTFDDIYSDEPEFSGDIYQYMIEQSKDIQFLLDKDGKFIFINKRVETLLGYKRSDLIGKHYTTIVHQSDLAKIGFRLHDKRHHTSRSVEVSLNQINKGNDVRFFEINSVSLSQPVSIPQQEVATSSNDLQKQAVTYCVAHDVSARKKVEQAVNKKSTYDYLTGLPNKLLFNDRLNLAVAQAKRDTSIFAVMYLDLDGFKAINDTFGHHIGDKVLMVISTRLRSCLREGDTLARVGGDEFTLLLPHVNTKNEAAKVAEKLTREVRKPFVINGKSRQLSVSVGITIFPEDGVSGKLLVESADKAMYQIKHEQKNGYQFYQHYKSL